MTAKKPKAPAPLPEPPEGTAPAAAEPEAPAPITSPDGLWMVTAGEDGAPVWTPVVPVVAAEVTPPAGPDRAAVLAQAAELLKASGFEVTAVGVATVVAMSPEEKFLADMKKLTDDARSAGVQPVRTMVMSYLRILSEKAEEVAAAIDEGGVSKKANGSKK